MKLALPTALISYSRRKLPIGEKCTNALDDTERLAAQFVLELHTNPAAARGKPEIPSLNGLLEHLLKAERFGTQLDVRCIALPSADLVFDGHDLARGPELDRVRSPSQTKLLRPHRHTCSHDAPSRRSCTGVVGPAMPDRAASRVFVVGPHAIDMNERSLSGTVREVFKSRDENRLGRRRLRRVTASVVSHILGCYRRLQAACKEWSRNWP